MNSRIRKKTNKTRPTRTKKAVGLSIKNPETCKLAKQLAGETGESLTAAITTAIRDRLSAVHRHRKKKADTLYEDLIALGKRGAKLAPGPYIDHDELLYDENGLPR